MKKLTAVTTALALTLCLAPSYVFAADPSGGDAGGECFYPTEFVEELTFTELAGYAFNGDTRAYADNKVISADNDSDGEPDETKYMATISIITPDEYGDERKTQYNCGFHVADIEYDGGNLYIWSEDGRSYLYSAPSTLTECDYTFTLSDNLSDGATGYIYTLELTDGGDRSLQAFKDGVRTTVFESGCSHLKQYNDTIYVVSDNAIYALNGTKATQQTLEYINLGLAENIATGDAAQALRSEYTPRTVRIQPQTTDGHDTFITKIDISSIGPTFETMGTERLMGERGQALALCQTGNATIVLMNDKNGEPGCYITLTTAIEETTYSAPPLDMTNAYAREDLTVYSRPYMCGSTSLIKVEKGTIFTVVEKFELSYMDDVFYKVTCKANGEDITGYVAENMLSPYTFSAEDEQEQSSGTDGFVYDNNIKTVVIVLLIVLLALVAAGYVTFYLTRNGGRKAGRKKSPPSDDDDLYT